MKAVIISGLIVLSFNLFGQNDPYYWYKGEKIALKLEEQKKFVLYQDKDSNRIVSAFEKAAWKVVKKDKERTVNTLVPYQKNKAFKPQSWSIIEKQKKGNADSLIAYLSDHDFYVAPFFITSGGDEAGLSHLFYVKLYEAKDIGILEDFAVKNNVEILGRNKFMPLWYTLSCTKHSKENALQMANLFYESGKFRAAEPDLMVDDLPQCVDDEFFSDQWNLNNTGQHGGTGGIDIQFCEGKELTAGCDDIVVAVVDQGIEVGHPDLINMFPLSYDTESDTSPSQVLGSHGTACAGIIGAAADNNEGIAGIAPDCQLMSVSNSLGATPNSRQRRGDGINWAWQNGADVISNSWGSSVQFEIIDDAIDNALTQGRNGLGCVVVFATGNDNSGVEYPANSNPDIIAVGAMSPCGERKSPDSCDGENWGSNYGNELDLVAPGVFIPTTDLQGSAGYNTSSGTSGDYYLSFNGTSASTPHVAGIAALILSVNRGLTQDEVRDAIESTCSKVGNYSYSTVSGRNNGAWNNQMGYGRVNAYVAVKSVYPSISGPDLVCSSGASFSVSNLPSGATITWSQSSNITRTSSQGSNPCTFTSTGSGEGWIGATVTTGCGDITLPSGNVYANDLPTPVISGPTTVKCGYELNYRVSNYSAPGGVSYSWDSDILAIVEGASQPECTVMGGNFNDTGRIYCTVTACGTSKTGSLNIRLICPSKP